MSTDWLKLVSQHLITKQARSPRSTRSLTHIRPLYSIHEEDTMRRSLDAHSRPTTPEKNTSDSHDSALTGDFSSDNSTNTQSEYLHSPDVRSRDQYYSDFEKDHEHITRDSPCSNNRDSGNFSDSDNSMELCSRQVEGCESTDTSPLWVPTAHIVVTSSSRRRTRHVSETHPLASSTMMHLNTHSTPRSRSSSCKRRSRSSLRHTRPFTPVASSTMISTDEPSKLDTTFLPRASSTLLSKESVCTWSIVDDVESAEDTISASYTKSSSRPQTLKRQANRQHLHNSCHRIEIPSRSTEITDTTPEDLDMTPVLKRQTSKSTHAIKRLFKTMGRQSESSSSIKSDPTSSLKMKTDNKQLNKKAILQKFKKFSSSFNKKENTNVGLVTLMNLWNVYCSNWENRWFGTWCKQWICDLINYWKSEHHVLVWTIVQLK